MFRNLQRVEEELNSSGVDFAPPIPRRPLPVGDVEADDDDDEGRNVDHDYLELEEEDLYEGSDVLPVPSMRQCRVLPGQISMPESSLPPAVMPRKQSCPDTAFVKSRAPKPLPETPAEDAGKPAMETVRRKPTDRPPVADRKRKPL